jgi:N-acetylmuramic acid 6-phosphate (MurNAc-6-P) etherase
MSSFTEAANAMSCSVDVAPPEQQAWTLRQADMLMLQGWQGHPGLVSHAFVKSMAVAAAKAGHALSNGGGVILSGAGSSGRLAAHAAASFNRLLPPSVTGKFMYTIAGGDGAIVKSAEALEDSPSAALQVQ